MEYKCLNPLQIAEALDQVMSRWEGKPAAQERIMILKRLFSKKSVVKVSIVNTALFAGELSASSPRLFRHQLNKALGKNKPAIVYYINRGNVGVDQKTSCFVWAKDLEQEKCLPTHKLLEMILSNQDRMEKTQQRIEEMIKKLTATKKKSRK